VFGCLALHALPAQVVRQHAGSVVRNIRISRPYQTETSLMDLPQFNAKYRPARTEEVQPLKGGPRTALCCLLPMTRHVTTATGEFR
jgi:hypothetical protein